MPREGHHLHRLPANDESVEQRQPEPVDVVGRREGAAVAVAEHRQVQGVHEVPLVAQVSQRGIRRQVVERQEPGARQPCRLDDEAVHDLVVRRARGSFEQDREHHVAAVAVGEPGAGSELLRVPLQHRQEGLGGGQCVPRDGEDVVGHLPVAVLVEVVPDPRGVGEQVLERDAVVDQRQVVAEQGADRLVEPQLAVLDEPHHGQRGERLAAAGNRDPGRRRHRDLEGAVEVALTALEDATIPDIHRRDARERLGSDRLVECSRIYVHVGPLGTVGGSGPAVVDDPPVGEDRPTAPRSQPRTCVAAVTSNFPLSGRSRAPRGA